MIVRADLEALDEIFVESVFADHPAHADRGSDYPIDHACFEVHALNSPDGCLAERTDLELQTVDCGECCRTETTLPILRRAAELRAAVARIVRDFQVSGDASFHGVIDVIHEEGV